MNIRDLPGCCECCLDGDPDWIPGSIVFKDCDSNEGEEDKHCPYDEHPRKVSLEEWTEREGGRLW